MRILVRNQHSGLYYRSPGEWVESAGEAKDFGMIAKAVQAQGLEKWGNVDVILRYEKPPCDLRVPLVDDARQYMA